MSFFRKMRKKKLPPSSRLARPAPASTGELKKTEIIKPEKDDVIDDDITEIVEVVFTLDTTGSMSGLIQAAKEKIWSVINQVVDLKPDAAVRVGLVPYRDRKDEYIVKVIDLTQDIDDMYNYLMDFKAAGGGDHPESVCQGLNESVKLASWTTDDKYKTTQIIFLVGDAPPSFYEDAVHYDVTCSQARERKMFINTIQCGRDQQCAKYWKDIAKKGGGEFIKIEQSGGTVQVDTPFDDEMVEASKKLDETRVYWGRSEDVTYNMSRKKKASKLYAMQSKRSLASRAGYQVKKAGFKKNFLGTKELVSDFSEGKVQLKNIQKQLPKEIQGLDEEKQGEYLKKKAQERERLKDLIKTLEIKRRKYIDEYKAKNREKFASSFDQNVLRILKKQIPHDEVKEKKEEMEK